MTSAPTSSEPAPRDWVLDAVEDLERVRAEAGPGLRRRLDRALGRLARMNGGDSVAAVLRRPSSTPFVPLVNAVAADLGLGEDPRAGLLGRSTVLLYAYVRLQDDLVDEPRRVDRASVFATEALLSEHLALFATAVPDARAAVLRAGIMRRFASVAADEVDDRGAGDAAASLDWMGEKFLPMAVPLVGLAVAAEQPGRAEPLVRFVVTLGTALQLVNDVLNVREDAAGGRTTPVLRWLKEGGALEGEGDLGARLLAHPALQRALDEARRYLTEAEQIALQAQLPATAAVARRAEKMIDDAAYRLLAATLGVVV